MNDSTHFDEDLLNTLHTVAGAGIHNAARGFSSLLGHQIQVLNPVVRVVPILEIPRYVGGPESEAIGIYLRAEGDIAGQIMLIIPYQKGLELVDLLMDVPAGTTKQLGSLERSALGEVGNLTGTFFLNAVANLTGTSVRPTPPAVIVDMVGAILDIIIATTGGVTDRVILMQAEFIDGERSVETNFWVIPDPTTLKTFRNGVPSEA
jgi:chemotaxis protein CheC|uniref:CheC-like protein domain-containing protein n=1 Tax=Anaerolinea thermolimosa TaxID=229919 RepID=A0A7C4KJB9_9CHLR